MMHDGCSSDCSCRVAAQGLNRRTVLWAGEGPMSAHAACWKEQFYISLQKFLITPVKVASSVAVYFFNF